MEWVLETGRARYVATSSQTQEAASAHSMPKMKTSGRALKAAVSAMPPEMVFVTVAPRATEPMNSKMAAMSSAPHMGMALEPTEVANALATSLAPARQKGWDGGWGGGVGCVRGGANAGAAVGSVLQRC